MGNKAYRERQKSKGLCCQCPTPVKPGKVLCDVCVSKRRYRRMLNIEIGLCRSCSLNPVVSGTTMCEACLKRHSSRQRIHNSKRYQYLKDNGCCPKCGINLEGTEKVVCTNCNEGRSRRRSLQ